MIKCPFCKGAMKWVEFTLVCPECDELTIKVLYWQKRLIREKKRIV